MNSQKTLYRARFVLPITRPSIEDGAVLVESRRITAIGDYRELAVAHPGATLVDFGESTLLPPMVNAHTHLELSAFADWAAAAGDPLAPHAFVDWILWLVRVRRNVSEDQLQRSLEDGLKQSLLAGTGAVGDIFTTLDVASAYHTSPLYGRVFAEVLGQDPTHVEKRLAVINALSRNSPSDSLEWGLSPHAPYTLSSSVADQVFAFAEVRSLQCSIHLAESIDETSFMKNGSGPIAEKLYSSAKWDPTYSQPFGCSPVAAFCRPGRMRKGDLAVHGVQVDSAGIDQLMQTGCSVVLCPRSNALLNVGKAPVADYLKAGVPLALGTDSRASSASLSIWDEMAFASEWFDGATEPCQWLEIATLGGAKALGLSDRLGHLSAGCEASFQVVSLPQTPAKHGLEAALTTCGSQIKVTHLYLAAENVLPEI